MILPIPYTPLLAPPPPTLLDVPTAWNGIPEALPDILRRFHVGKSLMVECGVDYGYSLSAFAHFFTNVLGVDTFRGDPHAGFREEEMYARVMANFATHNLFNVTLWQMDMEEFMKREDVHPDLVHVDLFHEYEPTRRALAWAVEHAPVTLAHDTRSFPDVMRACADVAEASGCYFYEWDQCHGLGILSRKEIGQ